MRFRLVMHDTKKDNKYDAERRYEFLGNREAIWFLWFTLKEQGAKHVEVFNLAGNKQSPQDGIHGLFDYSA